jgi:aldehyde:ferredoxin oxidoreductase
MEQDFSSLMHAGEKIFNLKHLINLRLGLDAASGRPHERFVTVKKKYGPAADHLPPVVKMVADYYRIRGWEADGKIKPDKATALGLDAIVKDTQHS